MSNKSVSRYPKKRCEAKVRSGQPCRAWAVRGGRFCSLHDERNRKKIERGRARGGRKPRAKVLAEELKEVRSFPDLLAFLNRLITDLYTDKVQAKQGQAIVSALSGVKATIETMTPLEPIGKEAVRLYDFDPSGFERIAGGEDQKAVAGDQIKRVPAITFHPKAVDPLDTPYPDEKKEKDGIPEEGPGEKSRSQVKSESLGIEEENGESNDRDQKGKVIVVDFCDTERFWNHLERMKYGYSPDD